jgi:hypothetical protein
MNMKKSILSLALLLGITVAAWAQSATLTVFSEDGDKFWVILNGVKQNQAAGVRVTTSPQKEPYQKMRIIFEDETIPALNQNVQFVDVENKWINQIYAIKKKAKGKYVLRWMPADATTWGEETAETPASTPTTTPKPTPSSPTPAPANTNTQQTTTQQTNSTINIKDDNLGVNINMNVPGMSVTTTTTTNSSNPAVGQPTPRNSGGAKTDVKATLKGDIIELSDGRVLTVTYKKLMMPYPHFEMLEPMDAKVKISYDGRDKFSSEVPFLWKNAEIDKWMKLDVEEENCKWSIKLMPKTQHQMVIGAAAAASSRPSATPAPAAAAPASAPAGCSQAMSASDFSEAKKAIESKGFEDTKLSTAKQIVKNNCLNTNQVKEIANLFGFEKTKLDFVKLAYDKTVDKNNYFKLGDIFGFSSSVDDLNNFLDSK